MKGRGVGIFRAKHPFCRNQFILLWFPYLLFTFSLSDVKKQKTKKTTKNRQENIHQYGTVLVHIFLSSSLHFYQDLYKRYISSYRLHNHMKHQLPQDLNLHNSHYHRCGINSLPIQTDRQFQTEEIYTNRIPIYHTMPTLDSAISPSHIKRCTN